MPFYNVLGAPITLLTEVGGVVLDLVDDIAVTEESNITKNPTESGVNITDHIVNLPVMVIISGRFVDSPLPLTGADADFFNPRYALEAGFVVNRSVSMWQALEDLRTRKELVDVIVQQNEYKNLAIQRLSAPRKAGDGGSQRFRIELQEIITVSSSSQPTVTPAEDVEHSAVAPIDNGVVAPL